MSVVVLMAIAKGPFPRAKSKGERGQPCSGSPKEVERRVMVSCITDAFRRSGIQSSNPFTEIPHLRRTANRYGQDSESNAFRDAPLPRNNIHTTYSGLYSVLLRTLTAFLLPWTPLRISWIGRLNAVIFKKRSQILQSPPKQPRQGHSILLMVFWMW